MAEATYLENTTLAEENTNLQMKLCINEEHLNAITTQLHQLQLQTAAQAFAMNTQTMGHGDTTTWHNKWGAMEMMVEISNNAGTQPTPFLHPPFLGYFPTPPASFNPGQQPTYLHFAAPNTSNEYFNSMYQFSPVHQPIMWNDMPFMQHPTMPPPKKPKPLQNHNYCWTHSYCMWKTHTSMRCVPARHLDM